MAETGTPSGIGWPDADERGRPSNGLLSREADGGGVDRPVAPGQRGAVGWPDVAGRVETPDASDERDGAPVVSRETFDRHDDEPGPTPSDPLGVSVPVESATEGQPPPAVDVEPDYHGMGRGFGGPSPGATDLAYGSAGLPLAPVYPHGEPADGDDGLTVDPLAVGEPVDDLDAPLESPMHRFDEDLLMDGETTRPGVASEVSVVDHGDDAVPDYGVDEDGEPTDVLPRLPILGSDLPRPSKGRVLVVANQKGGVGKTTTAVNLAAALVAYGARVLVVDLDPQGNASTALGIEHQEDVEGAYEVLIGERSMADIVQETPGVPGLYGAPATIKLAGAEIELVSFVARESRLKRPLESYLKAVEEAGEQYDYVLIDCPPSLGLLTLNALVAAKEVLIPIQCEYYALEGVSQLLRTIELVQYELNQELVVSTVILTMYDGRTRLAAGVAEEVRAHFGDRVLRTAVPRSVRISEAPSYGQTVITHDPTSSGALSYLEAAKEFALMAQPAAE